MIGLLMVVVPAASAYPTPAASPAPERPAAALGLAASGGSGTHSAESTDQADPQATAGAEVAPVEIAKNPFLTSAWVRDWFRQAAIDLADAKAQLNELDRQTGDGDHGDRICIGFDKAVAKLAEPDAINLVNDDDIAGLFTLVGMTIMGAVGGAFGPLFGTAMLRAARVVVGADIDPDELVAILAAAGTGIAERGQCQVGDKTMFDAWAPAVDAARQASAQGGSNIEVLTAAANAAERGAEQTKTMQARRGRAAYLGGRSVNHEDPGAKSVAIIYGSALTAAIGAPPPC